MSDQARKLVHSDIKPENPPERAAPYLDVPNMPWEATKFPGIKIKVLYTDDSGITTALFKLDPGAVVPRARSRTTRANAGQANSSGAPPAISTKQSRRTALCCSAFFSSQTVSPTAKDSSPRRESVHKRRSGKSPREENRAA